MKIFRKIVCYTILSVTLFSTCSAFAEIVDPINLIDPIEQSDEVECSESDILMNKLYLQYPDIWKIEYISENDNNLFYFRIFEKRGSMNYFIVEYNNDINNNLPKIKELIWIWAQKYDSEIRDIRFENVEENKSDAKVYLRNCEIIDEKIVFIDNPTENENLSFIEK